MSEQEQRQAAIAEALTWIGTPFLMNAEVKGIGVYSDLRFETGVHRVQRVPETEKAGRIHTSTASVAIIPYFSS